FTSVFFFSSRRRHTRFSRDWSSDVCSSDLVDHGDQDVLTIMRTSDLKILKVNQLPDKKSVGEFHWVSPERVMFNAVRKMGGYARSEERRVGKERRARG